MLEEDLRYNEKLFLFRRRRGLSRTLHARALGVDLGTYRAWEDGKAEGPPITLKGMDPWEHYAVLRIRQKLTEKEVASRIGISVRVLQLSERGQRSLARLREFWGE